MSIPELRWESSVFNDPLGGTILLWPYLPCVRMPAAIRPRKWHGLALIASPDEVLSIRQEEQQDKESPGIHADSASSSGTTLGMLVRDLRGLEVDGPSIPDPELIRLIRHAENSRGGLPIYPIEPGLDDNDWSDWQSRWADEQVRFRNLIATIGRSKRWSRLRRSAIPQVKRHKMVNAEMGAAATVCAAWWSEERMGLTNSLINQRDSRFCSRLRGALSDLLEKIPEDENTDDAVLLVPVQQAYLPSLEASLITCDSLEKVEME